MRVSLRDLQTKLLLASALLLALDSSSCHGVQIHQLESRIGELEARQAALEAKVEMPAKKSRLALAAAPAILGAMDSQEFLRRADECIERVEAAIQDFDPDELDYASSDGVITLEFADKRRYVLNRQSAANQMWFAAVARAWHFNWDAQRGAWIDDKEGRELYALVSDEITKKLGRGVKV